MKADTGTCPREARGKRVRGVLRNGHAFGYEQVTVTSPLGWDAQTTRWSLTDSPFDVAEFEVLP